MAKTGFKTKATKAIAKIFKPLIKSFAKDIIEENKDFVLDFMKTKLDIPKLTPEEEAKLYEALFAALEEAAVTLIDRI